MSFIELISWLLVTSPFVLGFLFGCNCCQSCTIFSDDFSTDRTGTDYSTRSGTWSVGSNVLTCTSASALLREETAIGSGATGCRATVTMTMATNSDKGRLCLAVVDDNNYWYCEVQPSGLNGTIKLFERVGGVDTQRGTTQLIVGFNATETVTVCLSIGGGVVAANAYSVTTGGAVGYAASPTVASTKAALGTGTGTSSVTFDDFTFTKHHVDDSSCPGSCGNCPLVCTTAPSSVSLTFTGVVAGGTPCPTNPATDWNDTFIVPLILPPYPTLNSDISCGAYSQLCNGGANNDCICDGSLLDDAIRWGFHQVPSGPDTGKTRFGLQVRANTHSVFGASLGVEAAFYSATLGVTSGVAIDCAALAPISLTYDSVNGGCGFTGSDSYIDFTGASVTAVMS